ncbi:NAD kinase 1 [Zea mays]|uniref:NAD kinase 1 n=1 Tax=Zea mays TaxID=4577 RepID=A0A1D6N0S2_MAIZE|nr:NAD kinase 1 [Zea mays]ONM34388.1 NAD kinase 1 [Zea mays]ONM34391.1 NAD kinase 1 [Zea mays]ONM34392.1 NAD kinase 1 [Zea mays]
MPLDELADKGPSSSEEVQLAPSDSKFRSLSPSPIPLPTLPSIRSLVHSVSDESVNVDVAASHQSENGSISTVSSLESERAAYEFLAQTPVRSTDAHLVEFSEAMRTVAKALRRVAEGKAAAQAEAAEWKRKYELETAHKHRSKIKGYSSCINNDLDKLVSQLTLETPTSDQLGCCGKHGICAHEILQDEVPGPIPRSNHKVVGRKASFKLSWGCNGDKNGQHKHDFVSFEKGDITTAERSNKQMA